MPTIEGIKTDLDYREISIDASQAGIIAYPEDEHDELVRLTRFSTKDIETKFDGDFFDINEEKAVVEWSVEIGGGRSYFSVYPPTITKVYGSYTSLKYTEGTEDPEEKEVEWESDSSWTLKTDGWGDSKMREDVAPSYIDVDLESKTVTVTFE
jgi:hypothetical protein